MPAFLFRPPPSAPINRLHSLADAVFLVTPAPDDVIDKVSGNKGTRIAAGGFDGVTARFGQGVRSASATADGAYWPGSPALYAITTQFTLAIWANPTTLVDYGNLIGIPYRSVGFTSPYYSAALIKNGNASSAFVLLGVSGSEFDLPASPTAFLSTSDGLTLYGADRSGTAGRYWRNGKLFGSATYPSGGAVTWSSQPIHVFNRSKDSNGEGVAGVAPFAAIWPRLLTDAEWRVLYENPFEIFDARVYYLGVQSTSDQTVSLTKALLSAASAAVTPAFGNANIALTPAHSTIVGKSLTAAPGNVNQALTPAHSTETGTALSIVAGNANVPLTQAQMADVGKTLTPAFGNVNVSLTPAHITSVSKSLVLHMAFALVQAQMTVAGKTLSPVAGNANVAASLAHATLVGKTLTISAGGVTITLTQAAITAAGDVVSAFVSQLVALTKANLSIAGKTITIAAGGVSISLSVAHMTEVGTALNITQSIAVSPAHMTGVAKALVVHQTYLLVKAALAAAGKTLSIPQQVALTQALMALVGNSVSAATGVQNISITQAALTAAGKSLTAAAGNVNLSLSPGHVVGVGKLTPIPQAQPISQAAMVASAAAVVGLLSQFAPLTKAVLAAQGKSLSLSPGNANAALNKALMTALGRTLLGHMTISLIAASVSLSSRSLVVNSSLIASVSPAHGVVVGKSLVAAPGGVTLALIAVHIQMQAKTLALSFPPQLISASPAHATLFGKVLVAAPGNRNVAAARAFLSIFGLAASAYTGDVSYDDLYAAWIRQGGTVFPYLGLMWMATMGGDHIQFFKVDRGVYLEIVDPWHQWDSWYGPTRRPGGEH